MPSDTSIMRLRAGASAILSFVVSIIVGGVVLSKGIDIQVIERAAVDVILPIMAANPAAIATVVWGVVISSALIAIFGIDLYRILADGQSGLLFAPVAMTSGSALFIIEVLLLLGVSQGLAPEYAGASGAELSAIEASARALLLFRTRMLLVAGVLWPLGIVIFGREMLRSSAFPDWMGYWGYAAGVAGVIGGFFPLFAPLLVVRMLGQSLFLFWLLTAGIILLRSR